LSASGVLAGALLVLGVLVCLGSSLGVLVMRDAYDRLHFTGPANTVGAAAVGAAVIVEQGLSAASVKVGLILVIVGFTNPLLVHATARAGRIREHGHWPGGESEAPEGT
jgi:monovalent cation/proton antiporter MnhG/PhaG subunit